MMRCSQQDFQRNRFRPTVPVAVSLAIVVVMGAAACYGEDPASPAATRPGGSEADTSKTGQPAPRTITNSVGMKLVLIPSGSFVMGRLESNESLKVAFKKASIGEAQDIEQPAHQVCISRPFHLGAYEVTVGQFRKFVAETNFCTEAETRRASEERAAKDAKKDGGAPLKLPYTWHDLPFKQDDNHPVVAVSHNDALAFCRWLSRREGKQYRLPTEAEWEYACRGGTVTRYWNGDDPEAMGKLANLGTKSTRAVGSYPPNPFGLYDMHGNVSEMCGDLFVPDYYQRFAGTIAVDPTGPTREEAVSFWRGYRAKEAEEAVRAGKPKPPETDWSKAVLPFVMRGGSFG
jgi:formylglycine-generating enzyme